MKQARKPNAFDDLATIAWLDLRGARNAFGRIHREPLRLAGWFFWIAFFVWKLLLQPRGVGSTSPADVGASIDIAASMLLLVASLSLVRGEQPAIAFFATPLEAYWLSGSRLRPWVTIPYIQLRNVFDRIPSFAIFLAFVLSYCLPPLHSPIQFFLGLFNVVVITLCTRLFSLPRELAPAPFRIPLIAIGLIAGAYALVGGLEAFSALLKLSPMLPAIIPHLHPGVAYIYGARGDLRVTCIAAGVLFACLGSLVVLCRDRYPELYEISRAGWEVRSRFRQGRMRERRDPTIGELSANDLARIPAGAAVLLWTNWQMYRRQNPREWMLVRFVGALGIGIAVTCVHAAPETLASTLGVVFALTTTFSSLIDAVRVGMAIRHPIFWLTQTSFSSRLTMVLIGWYWRSALDLVLFGAGAICAGAPWKTILPIVVLALIVVWLQRSIGLAAFALLPSKVDVGGPTALARFGLAIVFAVPPIVLGIVIATMAHALVLGYVLGAVLALCEAQVLIFCAGRLLDGRFDKILGA